MVSALAGRLSDAVGLESIASDSRIISFGRLKSTILFGAAGSLETSTDTSAVRNSNPSGFVRVVVDRGLASIWSGTSTSMAKSPVASFEASVARFAGARLISAAESITGFGDVCIMGWLPTIGRRDRDWHLPVSSGLPPPARARSRTRKVRAGRGHQVVVAH